MKTHRNQKNAREAVTPRDADVCQRMELPMLPLSLTDITSTQRSDTAEKRGKTNARELKYVSATEILVPDAV